MARTLTGLDDLPLTAEEQRLEAGRRATTLSIQGVQPERSAVLRPKERRFEIVNRGGTYIIEPPHVPYPNAPENEGLTMRLAGAAGIEVPVHGLLRGRDGSWTYFIRRFDRLPRGRRIQLAPAYDLLNTSIVLPAAQKALALPPNGKKWNLRPKDLLDYFAVERLGRSWTTVNRVVQALDAAAPRWQRWIELSFLPESLKDGHLRLTTERFQRLTG